MKNTQVGMTNNFFILLNAIVLTNEAENTTFTTFHPVDINLLICLKPLNTRLLCETIHHKIELTYSI